MNRILEDAKRILIAVGLIFGALGQVVVYLPTPPSSKSLGMITTIIGMGSAISGVLLQVVERTQANQPVDVQALAQQLHVELDKAHTPVNPAPVEPAT